MNIFYVYKHTFSDGSFYLGKGAGGRSHQFTKGRSSVYMELLKRFGAPKVEILHKDMQEDEAYDIENKLILKSRKESAKIINRTDGLERANVGVMPPQTLIFYDSSKNTHPKYKQRVHLKNIKQSGSYSISITIIDAAIKTKTTCDELLKLLSIDKNIVIGEHKFIDQEEAIAAAPFYREEIISNENKSRLELQSYKCTTYNN